MHQKFFYIFFLNLEFLFLKYYIPDYKYNSYNDVFIYFFLTEIIGLSVSNSRLFSLSWLLVKQSRDLEIISRFLHSGEMWFRLKIRFSSKNLITIDISQYSKYSTFITVG